MVFDRVCVNIGVILNLINKISLVILCGKKKQFYFVYVYRYKFHYHKTLLRMLLSVGIAVKKH